MPREIQKMAFAVLIFSEGFDILEYLNSYSNLVLTLIDALVFSSMY